MLPFVGCLKTLPVDGRVTLVHVLF